MPRKYKRKDTARKCGYSAEVMQKALTDVKENGMSLKKAAFLYGINRTTLMNHYKDFKVGKVGRPTILTNLEESIIMHALKKLGDWGFGIDREAVKSIVRNYLNMAGRPNMFKHDNKPGIDWMLGFEARWRNELTRHVGQPLPANRAFACNKAVVDDFFVKLRNTVDRNQR